MPIKLISLVYNFVSFRQHKKGYHKRKILVGNLITEEMADTLMKTNVVVFIPGIDVMWGCIIFALLFDASFYYRVSFGAGFCGTML